MVPYIFAAYRSCPTPNPPTSITAPVVVPVELVLLNDCIAPYTVKVLLITTFVAVTFVASVSPAKDNYD